MVRNFNITYNNRNISCYLISEGGSKYACLDGKIVKDKSECSTQCGNCECESLETIGNCPQDCDENYYRTHLNEGCPSCAPLWNSLKGTCTSAYK